MCFSSCKEFYINLWSFGCRINVLFGPIFTEAAPLGRFSHRVAMSVRVCVLGCAPPPWIIRGSRGRTVGSG